MKSEPPRAKPLITEPTSKLILVPKGYSKNDGKTYKLVEWGGINYKILTTPESTEMNKSANIKSRRRRKTKQILHDLMKKRDY